jgi:hypothetical protein
MHLLQKTSAFLLCPIIAFFGRVREPIDEVLAFLVILVVITSQFLWTGPIKGSRSHRIDSYVTKTAILIFISITFERGFSNIWWEMSYMTVIGMMALAFWLSNHYSSIEWNSREHILSHSMVHYWGLIGSLYAFK